MKKFKKLIPALAMLLVSASMMGTSTFAWFSMNTTVTATGMEVKARSSEALAISANGTDFSDTMTLATNASELYPVSLVEADTTVIGATATSNASASTASTTDLSFYQINYDHNTVTDPNNYAATITLPVFLGDPSAAANAGAFDEVMTNYVTDDLWLKYIADAGTHAVDLKITVSHAAIDAVATDVAYTDYNEYNTINGTSLTSGEYAALPAAQKIKTPAGTYNTVADYARDMENAFHVALVDADGNVWNYDVTGFADTDTDSDSIYDAYVLSISSFVTLTANTAKQYTVYAWYEGEDTDCTTAKAVSVTDLTVDLEFKLHS